MIAADVDVTLLGMFGATKTFGPQKGLTDEPDHPVDGVLDQFVVATCGPTPAERRIADAKGAGAAGGLGFALMLLGGTVVSGIDLVAEAVGLTELAAHDLVVTGEGTYDFSSRSGKVVYGVATVAAAAARPCIVLAGQVSVGSREMRAMGVESAYAMADLVGLDAAMGDAIRRHSPRWPSVSPVRGRHDAWIERVRWNGIDAAAVDLRDESTEPELWEYA